MPATPWELLPEESIQKSVTRKTTYPQEAGSYGPVFYWDLSPCRTVLTFRAHGLTETELDTYRTAIRTRNQLLTVTDSHGRSWTGYPLSVAPAPIEGVELDDGENFTLQMEIPEDD